MRCVELPNLMILCKQYFSYLFYVKNCFEKAFPATYWQSFDRTKFFEANKNFSQKFESSLEVLRAKRKFSDNLGHNILKL